MRAHLLLSVPLLSLVVHASAQTTRESPQSFNVSIAVTKACTLDSASDIFFPPVSAADVSPTATGTIQVTCSFGTAYQLGLDYGAHENPSGTRNMQQASGSIRIPYILSQDAGHSTPWGSAPGDLVTGEGAGMGTAVPHTVHAQADLTGNEPPGTYEDTVQAILTF